MVTLAVTVFLSALGLVLWGVGYAIDDPGLAAIGGVLVVGIGVMITTGSLEYQSGETKTDVDSNTTDVSYEYKPVDAPSKLPMGILVMLGGALCVFHGLNPGD